MSNAPKASKRRGALIVWLIICLIATSAAIAVDFLTARPAYWIAARPLGRAAIGLAAVAFVVIAAWLGRFVLARKPPVEGEGAHAGDHA
ncbi:MAG TPA: hypothetical protein VG943_07730 [Caulobacterales bacterium]|nr:hypothetical protein [Caulobacterales bacterium]